VNFEPARARGDATNYFLYGERELRAEISQLLRYGAASFLIGAIFLILCLAMRRWLPAASLFFDRSIVDDCLLILGWVALWRPTEVLLYDWWPLVRRRVMLKRLAVIPVEIRVTP
jgi:hypothetical protein